MEMIILYSKLPLDLLFYPKSLIFKQYFHLNFQLQSSLHLKDLGIIIISFVPTGRSLIIHEFLHVTVNHLFLPQEIDPPSRIPSLNSKGRYAQIIMESVMITGILSLRRSVPWRQNEHWVRIPFQNDYYLGTVQPVSNSFLHLTGVSPTEYADDRIQRRRP